MGTQARAGKREEQLRFGYPRQTGVKQACPASPCLTTDTRLG
jgi:hypothetical protein